MAEWYEASWYFLIFSAIGWANDSFFNSWYNKKVVNSGMLVGPWCPIYGFGALLIYYLVSPFTSNPVLLFVMTAALCTTLELVTGLILTRFFGRRWWDYTQWPFNINGYIALPASLWWGFLGLILVYVMMPLAQALLAWLPAVGGQVILGALGALFVVDVVATAVSLFKLRSVWRKIAKLGSFEVYKVGLSVEEKLAALQKKVSWSQQRFLKGFPMLKKHFEESVKRVRMHKKSE
jgi:uncharacterized membrane protein